jgi:hypothetical protein
MIFKYLTTTVEVRYALATTLYLIALPPTVWSVTTFQQCACRSPRGWVLY